MKPFARQRVLGPQLVHGDVSGLVLPYVNGNRRTWEGTAYVQRCAARDQDARTVDVRLPVPRMVQG
jgi:hypothetical protein